MKLKNSLIFNYVRFSYIHPRPLNPILMIVALEIVSIMVGISTVIDFHVVNCLPYNTLHLYIIKTP